MEIFVKISLISIFSPFLVINHNLIVYVYLPVSQLQTQQLIMSQIRSYIEYLMQTLNILVLILFSKSMKNLASLKIFNMI